MLGTTSTCPDYKRLLRKCRLAKQVITSDAKWSAMSSSPPLVSMRREKPDNAISRTPRDQDAQQNPPTIDTLSKIYPQLIHSDAESHLGPGEGSRDFPESSSSNSSPPTHFHGLEIGPSESEAWPPAVSNVSLVECASQRCTPTPPPVHPSSLHESPAIAARPTPRIKLPKLSIPKALPRQRTSLSLSKETPLNICGLSRRTVSRRLLPTPPNNLEAKLFSLFQQQEPRPDDDDFRPLPSLDPVLRIAEHSGRLKSTVRCLVCDVRGGDLLRCDKCGDVWCSKECQTYFQMTGPGTNKHVCHPERSTVFPACSANASTSGSTRVSALVTA